MLLKLFTPGGLIIIAIILAIIFIPRRLPDAAKKLRKPMKAFPDEPTPADDSADKDSDRPSQT